MFSWREIQFDDPKPEVHEGLLLKGRFVIERWSPYGVRLGRYHFPNQVLLAGMKSILDIMFDAGTQITTWYMGLIGGSTVTIDEDDTPSSHSGWTEDQNYDEATRPIWNPRAATASGKIKNSSSSEFTMNAATTIRGLFIISENTKGGTSGTLWSAATLDAVQVVSGSEILRGYYELQALDG